MTDVSLAEIEAAGPRRRRLRRPARCRGVAVRDQPAGRRRRRRRATPDHRPDVTGEVLRRAPRTSRTATTGCGPPSVRARRTPGWHRTGDVGHLDDAGRLWVEGRLVHVVTTADGPVTPVGVEQRDRGARPGSRRPPSSASARPAPSRSSWSSCRPRRRPPAGAGRPPTWPAPSAAAAAVAGRGRAGGPRAAGRHPARLQDRPRRGRPLGRPGAGRRRVGQPVRVLVTGASGMLGRGVARAARRARRRRDRAAAAAVRAAVCARCSLTSPTRPRWPGRARAGRRRAPGRQGQRRSGRWPTTSGPTSTAPRAVVDGLPRRRRRPAGARLLPVGGPRRVGPGRRRAPGRPTRARARGHYARSKAVAERLALARGRPPTWRWWRSVRTWSGGPATPSWSPGSSSGPAPGGCRVVGSGAALIDTHLRRQRRRRARRRPRPLRARLTARRWSSPTASRGRSPS